MRELEQSVERPQTTRDVVIGRNRFQIVQMNAAIGSWLLFKLIDSLRKIAVEVAQDNTQPTNGEVDKDAAASALIQAMLMTLDREAFEEVQREALRVCGQYALVGEKETVLPVLMANGSFAIPELRNDIAAVVTLTSNALHFNLSPFFLGDGLKTMFQA
jgi:hypothetical protein